MLEDYVVIVWPESQNLMDLDGFEDNSELINDPIGLARFGPLSLPHQHQLVIRSISGTAHDSRGGTQCIERHTANCRSFHFQNSSKNGYPCIAPSLLSCMNTIRFREQKPYEMTC